VNRLQNLARSPYLLLIPILLLAWLLRLPDMTTAGHVDDMLYFNAPWARGIQRHGLFSVYATTPGVDYPPIFLTILWLTSSLAAPFRGAGLSLQFTVLTKFFSVAAELLLIALLYAKLPPARNIRWLLPLLFALSPGLIAVSAFWGQTDSILTLLLVLSIFALNRRQSRRAWLWFALALLMKFQAIVLLPMLGLLSLRRFGLWRTLQSIALAFALLVLLYLPFILTSGYDPAMRPYGGAVDLYPFVTANAHNLWYIAYPQLWSQPAHQLNDVPLDTLITIFDMTASRVGFLLLFLTVAIIAVRLWRDAHQPLEFVWAAALYLAFFLLPTQIHERYIYPAAVLALIAVAQDRRFWPIAAGLAVTCAYNIVVVPRLHFVWLGLDLPAFFGNIALWVALANLILFFWLLALLIRPALHSHRRR